MNRIASQFPEYPVVLSLHGVGTTLGPQLIAEIGDVRRFHNRKALIAYAGIDSSPYQSGTIDIKSRGISKRGSATLRKTLFTVMDCILRHKHTDEPVYQFLDKKRAEGKHYYVYMIAGCNKFLRIYYAKVSEYLNSLEKLPTIWACSGLAPVRARPWRANIKKTPHTEVPHVAGLQGFEP